MNGRDKRRAKSRRNAARAPLPECMNCGEKGRHFVPPSLGESGFFTCDRTITDLSRFPIRFPEHLFDEPLMHRTIGTRVHQQIEDYFKPLDPNHFRNIDNLFGDKQ